MKYIIHPFWLLNMVDVAKDIYIKHIWPNEWMVCLVGKWGPMIEHGVQVYVIYCTIEDGHTRIHDMSWI